MSKFKTSAMLLTALAGSLFVSSSASAFQDQETPNAASWRAKLTKDYGEPEFRKLIKPSDIDSLSIDQILVSDFQNAKGNRAFMEVLVDSLQDYAKAKNPLFIKGPVELQPPVKGGEYYPLPEKRAIDIDGSVIKYTDYWLGNHVGQAGSVYASQVFSINADGSKSNDEEHKKGQLTFVTVNWIRTSPTNFKDEQDRQKRCERIGIQIRHDQFKDFAKELTTAWTLGDKNKVLSVVESAGRRQPNRPNNSSFPIFGDFWSYAWAFQPRQNVDGERVHVNQKEGVGRVSADRQELREGFGDWVSRQLNWFIRGEDSRYKNKITGESIRPDMEWKGDMNGLPVTFSMDLRRTSGASPNLQANALAPKSRKGFDPKAIELL